MRVAVSAVLVALAAGCGPKVPPRQARQAVTILNAGATTDICRVWVRGVHDTGWSEFGSIDPIAPGRSRTLRVRHGRWRFRFAPCERGGVLEAPAVDVAFTRVVFLLCDARCNDAEAPQGALVVRHRADEGGWGIQEPVFQPTGRRRARLVL